MLERLRKTAFYGLCRRMKRSLRIRRYKRESSLNGKDLYHALDKWFYKKTGRRMNIKDPKGYDDKIQWLKLYDSTPLKTRLADKYLVREYVKEKIGAKYLTKLLGVYENFDQIDFSSLPKSFVMKANHGSKFNIIVKDKDKLDIRDAENKFRSWLDINYAYYNGYELHYRDIRPLIIIEEYLENDNEELIDYKISCFNGKPAYVQYINNRRSGLQIAVYDTEWNKQNFSFGKTPNNADIERPAALEEMVKIAGKLSEVFTLARVDLYVLNDGSVKFGEITFTPLSGVHRWEDLSYDRMLGDLMDLPEKYRLSGIDYSFEELLK